MEGWNLYWVLPEFARSSPGEYEALDQQSLALTEEGESRASRLALRQALEGCISYSRLLQIPRD